jgi:Intracellular proteinase inhibitor
MRNRVALMLALAMAACVEEAAIAPVPQQILNTYITATDRDLDPGENTTLTIRIQNPLEEIVRLTFPTTCQALVFIRNASGRIMTPENGTYECAEVRSLLTIQPGDTASFNVIWGGGIEFGPYGTSTRVPPGDYYASAEFRSDERFAVAFPILIVVR